MKPKFQYHSDTQYNSNQTRAVNGPLRIAEANDDLDKEDCSLASDDDSDDNES